MKLTGSPVIGLTGGYCSATPAPILWAEAVGADGVFSFRAARRNHAPYFVVHDGEDFLLVRKSCVLLQRTTAKEQAHRLIAAELPQSFIDEHGAVTVENHLNMIVAVVPKPLVETKTLAAFLNSAAADRAFRCISGTVAVSAYELESMPLPPHLIAFQGSWECVRQNDQARRHSA